MSHSTTAGPLSNHRSIERGRSRIVSPVALARRASEERRTVVHTVSNQSTFPCRQRCHNPHAGPSTPSVPPLSLTAKARAGKMVPSNLSKRHSANVKSATDARAASESRPESRLIPQVVSTRTARPEISPSSRAHHHGRVQWSTAQDKSTSGLQEQMQAAYAAENMHLARILYLKLKGIEVISDDDPRISQVRDEDFVFVPGGELVLDEESLAAMREAEKRDKERRDRDGQVDRWKAKQPYKSNECEDGRHEKIKSRTTRFELDMKLRMREPVGVSNSPSQFKELRVRTTKFGRVYTNNGITRRSLLSQSVQAFILTDETRPTSLMWDTRPNPTHATANSISYQEVMECMRGPLFRDSDMLHDAAPTRTRAQTDLLQSLLHDPEYQMLGSRRVKGTDRQIIARTWTESPAKTSLASNACLACSLDSVSTISRTNSWASYSSSASISTAPTSPPNSPVHNKAQLPAAVDFPEPRVTKHSCMQRATTVVPLSSTPLSCQESAFEDRSDLNVKHFSYNPIRQRRGDKRELVTRVKQSVSSLLDFASKVQQSYIRTIQFATPIPLVESETLGAPTIPLRSILMPVGFRVKSSDVRTFAPPTELADVREPLFPSEHNWPLVDANSEPLPPQIFTPIAFVPRSPLRPRYMPLNPEWRLRPVANPVTLRLKALQNVLGEHGVPWEGRAHAGSLGCGRDRLTGVAFEGLGGSRLAFEAKPTSIR